MSASGARQANCHVCKCPITLANVLLMTDTILIWECDCGTQTHRDLAPEVREAVCGPYFHPRLPYVAAPNPMLPLDDFAEMSVRYFRTEMSAVCCADDFHARAAHDIAWGSRKAHQADGDRPQAPL